MAVSCEEVETVIALVASGKASGEERRLFEAHLAMCPGDCRRELEALEETWRALDQWSVEPPPARIGQALAETVRRDLGARGGARTLVVSMVLGVVAALVSGLAVHVRTPVTDGGLWLLLCGGVLAAAYGVAFYLLMTRGVTFDARAALWASGALVVMTLVLPVSHGAAACASLPCLACLLGLGEMPHFLAGLTYGLLPAAVGFAAARSRVTRRGTTLLTLATVLAVVLPLVYLQCLPFAGGALVSALGGAILGAGVAGLAKGALSWWRAEGASV